MTPRTMKGADVETQKQDWEVVRDRNQHWGLVEVRGPGVGGYLTIGFTVATDVSAEEAAQIVADAHLIAAAKKLLAACQALDDVEWIGGTVLPRGLLAARDKARAAIASAGAQP